jgi:hypothetical protein
MVGVTGAAGAETSLFTTAPSVRSRSRMVAANHAALAQGRAASWHVNERARCAAVPVVPQSLHRGAVTAGTGPAWVSYDVDAATMHLERHERGIHAV